MLPFGVTRSSVQRDHAMIASDSHVQAVLPGWTNAKGIILISPAMGARFVQYFALMQPGAKAGPPAPGMQRFVYVMDGAVKVSGGGVNGELKPGGYAYFPAGAEHSIESSGESKLLLIEKRFTKLAGGTPPRAIIGREQDIASAAFMGDEAAQLKNLLPDEPGYDIAVNIFAYAPGGMLPFVEVHIMEHGLIMLDGMGVYRLSESWYPVAAGDVIWMAPYCAQWFVAGGKTWSRYLYYKDVNRDAMVVET
ncbi:(S)-ureidoglycine aminohydrolase [soil metagenome]